MNYRNGKLLKVVREAPCMICGIEDGTVCASHSNQLRDGRGHNYKSHDYRIAALCYKCHNEIDYGKNMSREEKVAAWDDAHRKTIGWLFDNNYLVCS